MALVEKKVLKEMFNVFGYSINDKKPGKTKPNYQFMNKLQYLLNHEWNKYSFRLKLKKKLRNKYGR